MRNKTLHSRGVSDFGSNQQQQQRAELNVYRTDSDDNHDDM